MVNHLVPRATCALLFAAVAGCASVPGQSVASAEARAATPDWRRVATAQDRTRIRSWRQAFVKGLTAARAGGHGDEIAKEGQLLVPDAALVEPRPPAGDYRCRVIKLGANGSAMRDYTAYPSFACRIDDEGDIGSFKKITGSQRPTGLIFADGGSRLIFLGTMMLGDERRPVDYGADPERDMAGQIERIDDLRWRLVLPYPKFESLVDVIELVPAD